MQQKSDSWEMGNRWGELYDCSGLQLEESFPAAKQEGGTQAEYSGLPELRESGEAREAGVYRAES